MEPKAKMDKATSLLLRDQPFWGTLLLNLKVEERRDLPVKTLATDGVKLMYDPEYVANQGLSTLITDTAHEVGHVMFMHPLRRGQRDPKVWNMAGDYVVNDFLIQSGFKLGADYLYDPCYHGLDVERVYDLLWKNPETQPKNSCGCGGLHDHPGKGGGEGKNGKAGGSTNGSKKGQQGNPSSGQTEGAIRTALAQARAFARNAGKLPMALDTAIENIINPRVSPEEVLRQFLERTSADDYTWQAPSRQHQHLGLYLPSMSSEAVAEIVFVVDTSGSMPISTLDKVAGWVSKATEALPIHRVHVVFHDATVAKTETYERSDLPIKTLHPTGGGGTDFRPPYNWVKDQGLTPKALIHLTDLYCESFPEPPEYPVIWVSTSGKTSAPFGEVIQI